MALPSPILDNRSYAQLRDELIARIPVYAPEWTDHHPSDPGITLLELFAYLGENLLFRFNQIPDHTKLAFLDLLQIGLRPAEPATGMVTFTATTPAGAAVPLRSEVRAGDVAFETLDEVHAWPLTAHGVIRHRADTPLTGDTAEYFARAAAAAGVAATAATTYRTVFGAADPMQQPDGDTLHPESSIDGSLYIALTTAKPDDPTLADIATAVQDDASAPRLLSIGFVPAGDVPTMEDRAATPCPGAGLAVPSPPMEWEICTGVADSDVPGDPEWLKVEVVGDSTDGLTVAGVVRLRLPADLHLVGPFESTDPDARGTGDQPPLVEDLAFNLSLRAWLRVFRPTDGAIPPVAHVVANATRIEQAGTAEVEFVATGTGDPSRSYPLVHGNVLGEVALEVEELGAGRWVPWRQVDDFRGSGVDDRHFVLDHESGTLTCGDGRRGRVWRLGERIRARTYRYGGGAAGNVAPGAVNKLVDGGAAVKVANTLPTHGGTDAEPLADGIARIPDEFGRHDRAVTVSDFQTLAEQAPGAGVTRAEVLRLFDPLTPTVESPGAISVVVWGGPDRSNPTAPRPDRTTLDAVCAYLDDRRLVTTELHVIPPTYRRIAVSVGISVKPGHGIESVRRWVELALRQYLAPVLPFGPGGRGWPLGRRVFAPELEAVALQVDGVEFLVPSAVEGSPCQLGLRLAELGPDGVWVESDAEQRSVPLRAWEVPALDAIAVVDGPALAPGVLPVATPPNGRPVPVREPRTVC